MSPKFMPKKKNPHIILEPYADWLQIIASSQVSVNSNFQDLIY